MKNKTVLSASVKKNKRAHASVSRISHDYTCDICEKPAKYNMQDWWHTYTIDKEGSFEDYKDWEGDTSEFYCEKCAKKERNHIIIN